MSIDNRPLTQEEIQRYTETLKMNKLDLEMQKTVVETENIRLQNMQMFTDILERNINLINNSEYITKEDKREYTNKLMQQYLKSVFNEKSVEQNS